jgi:16S rRNA (guanine966-N2)-methyltransferase
MRGQLRIVAGELRGRKLTYTLAAGLRPTPDRVREALFNILRNAVPGRVFVDLYAGTGAVGLEALSRGAERVEFVERDSRLAGAIHHHLQAFAVTERAGIHRADVARWVERWQAPAEPVTVFLGPPFPDLELKKGARVISTSESFGAQSDRNDSRPLFQLLQVMAELQHKVAPESVLVLQSEKTFIPDKLPDRERWEHRRYGRNQLSIWVK